jgi:small subunit ribosomal protein S8
LEYVEFVLGFWLIGVNYRAYGKRVGKMTDTIADMLTRIRNALMVKRENVEIPASNIKIEIAKILKEEGFIKNFEVLVRGNFKILRVSLKYSASGESFITHLRRISTPGRRIYSTKEEIFEPLKGLGRVIFSTSKGVVAGRKARQLGVGGEVLFEVW